ncbi:ABC transporter ATP-binding protein [Cryptosporangium sp. NPDC051539]|uniref:ABC transporter ATP-binding protein n=1 Tax=Cryptosporangium sp. NPDC051539 TaxID=3363962 RepID=UPI0037A7C76C
MTRDLLPIAGPGRTGAWLWRELRAHRFDSAATLLVGLIAAAAAIVPAYVLGYLVDQVRAGAEPSVIVRVTIAVVAAAVLGGIATGFSTMLIARLCGRILADLRERVVSRALTLPTPVLERAGKGDLLSRVGADVATIGQAVTVTVPNMVASVLLGVLSLAAMAGIDWRLGLAGAVAVPAYGFALRWYLPRSAPGYAAHREAIAERGQLLVDSAQGLRTVHAYQLERRHLAEIDVASAKARDVSVSVFALFTRFVGRVNRAEFLGLASILVFGFVLVENGYVTVGETSAAAVLFHRLFNPIGVLLFGFDDIQAGGASLARLVGVVDLPPEPTPPAGPAPADASLELSGVDFSYDGTAQVLFGVGLRVEPGQRVALVGSTGAGKSTLALIAAGSLTPTAGSALVGGVPVASLPPDEMRRQVAIISQETHVFAGPLLEDLRLARPGASSEEAEEALRTVDALGWVSALADGLDTVVGEGGHELTPAQAQQLALARLVLRDPAIAILDEATAEAGSAGARALEESAAAATRGRTTLVVAHRLTQAASADRIVVLEHGRVVEDGSHAALVAAGGRYAELWTAWEGRVPRGYATARATGGA